MNAHSLLQAPAVSSTPGIGASAATGRQTFQKYFCVWFLVHLFEINNPLYALSAAGANEEVVRMESNRHGGMESNRHGGQIIGLPRYSRFGR